MAACTPPKSPARSTPSARLQARSHARRSRDRFQSSTTSSCMLWFSINPDGQNMVATGIARTSARRTKSATARALPGVRRARQQSRRLHEQHAGIARSSPKRELEWDPAGLLQPAPDRALSRAHLHSAVRRPRSPATSHPLMARWLNVIGIDMAAYLDEHGMPGAMHRVTLRRLVSGLPRFHAHLSAIPSPSLPRPRSIATPRRTSTPSTIFRGTGSNCAPRSSTPARGRADGGAWAMPSAT